MTTDGERLGACVRLIAATWPNWHYTADTVNVYVRFLGRLPIDEVEAATELLIAGESEFAPTPGRIATVVAERLLNLPSVEHAVEQVNAAVSPWDVDAWNALAEPVRRAVKALGGISTWRESSAESTRRDFRSFYTAFRREAIMEIAAPGLPVGGETDVLTPDLLPQIEA